MTRVELSVVAVLAGLYGLFFVALLVVAWVRGAAWKRRAAASAELAPRLHAAIIEFLTGKNDVSLFRSLKGPGRADLANLLLQFEPTVSGSGRDRLCELSLELGLVHEWMHDAHAREPGRRRIAYQRLAFAAAYEPCRRVVGDMLARALEDSDNEVFLVAARAAMQAGDRTIVEQVFDLALEPRLFSRILLSESLRPHAVTLSERAVPAALRSPDKQRVLATIGILVAWQRAVPVPDLEALLDDGDRAIRLAALRLAPLVPLTPAGREAVIRALGDPDVEMVTAAAECAARLRMEETLPLLARLVRVAPAGLARTAAAGLAAMPPRGFETLAELCDSENPVTAAAAREAQERLQETSGP